MILAVAASVKLRNASRGRKLTDVSWFTPETQTDWVIKFARSMRYGARGRISFATDGGSCPRIC